MSAITHHAPESLLVAYAAGSLGYAFDLVVATHVSMCDECRARLNAVEAAGGAVMEETGSTELSPDLRYRVMDSLNTSPEPIVRHRRNGIYPGPLVTSLNGEAPRWNSLGMGIKQTILHEDDEGSVRLLQIPPEQAVPEHSHGGNELTLVLQGSFEDETGVFAPGDLEVADGGLEHVPTARPGAPCICLAATDAPLKFTSWLPRLTQRFFRI